MNGVLLLAFAALVPQDSGVVRLPTVEVSVSRDPARSALEIPFALTRVVPDSIRPGLRNATVDERLFLLPGVIVANRSNPTQDPRISIRGFGSRSAFGVRGVRVQLDGVPLTLPDGQTAIDYLDLESIGRLEVIRGSAASLYGNAAGGVVDIRSREIPAVPFEPTASYWGGSAGQSKFTVGGGGSFRNSRYAISLSRMQGDGYREHARQEISNGSLRFSTDFGRFTVGASLLAHDMPVAQNPGALTLAELQENIRGAEALAVTRKARKEVSQVQGGVSLGWASADGRSEVEGVVHGGTRDLYNPLQFALVNLDRRSQGASIRGSTTFELLGRPSRLTVGADLQSQDDARTEHANCNGVVNATTCPDAGAERGVLRRDQEELVRSLGPYAKGEVQLSEQLLVSAGLRSDRVRFEVRDAFITNDNPDDSGERTLRAVSPMAGAVWRPGRLVSVYGNYSTAFETPTATELGNKPDGSAGFNPELDPQRSATWELGSRGWVGAVLRGGFYFDVALYRTSVEDELIPFEIPGGAGRRYFRNAGRTLRTGVETQLSAEVGPAALSLSYTYSHFRFDEYMVADVNYSGRRIPGIPVQQLQLSGTVRSGPAYLTLDGETRGSVFANDANTVRSAGYELLHMRLGATAVGKLNWIAPRVGVQNVFDRRHVPSVSVNATNGRYYEPAPGRTFYAGVSIGGS